MFIRFLVCLYCLFWNALNLIVMFQSVIIIPNQTVSLKSIPWLSDLDRQNIWTWTIVNQVGYHKWVSLKIIRVKFRSPLCRFTVWNPVLCSDSPSSLSQLITISSIQCVRVIRNSSHSITTQKQHKGVRQIIATFFFPLALQPRILEDEASKIWRTRLVCRDIAIFSPFDMAVPLIRIIPIVTRPKLLDYRRRIKLIHLISDTRTKNSDVVD